MTKQPKPRHAWTDYGNRVVCENPEQVVGVHLVRDCPVSCDLWVAYHGGIEGDNGGWLQGRRASSGPGWRYGFVAHTSRHLPFSLYRDHRQFATPGVYANAPAYLTRRDAIRAAVEEFISVCEEHLAGPDGPALAYWLCLPEWEPLWEVYAPIQAYDEWVRDCNAPKTTLFTEQLSLF